LYKLKYAASKKMRLEVGIVQSCLLDKYGSILLDAVKIISAGYCTKCRKYGVCRGYLEEAAK
jgi:hypothetical protein